MICFLSRVFSIFSGYFVVVVVDFIFVCVGVVGGIVVSSLIHALKGVCQVNNKQTKENRCEKNYQFSKMPHFFFYLRKEEKEEKRSLSDSLKLMCSSNICS